MVTKTGSVRLIDFGLATAKRKGEGLEVFAGTPMFMAPEVLEGQYGTQGDMWSLGVLLYMLVSGHHPF